VLRKVRVPSAVFPVAAIGANFVNLVLAVAALSAVTVLARIHPPAQPIWLATGLLSLAAFTLGSALALAAANVFFRDVRYFFEALMPVLFYATPIAYPADVVPYPYSLLVHCNPMHWFLELLRAALWSGSPPAPGATVLAPLLGAAMLVAGWSAFSRLERRFYLYL
jgi:ABC-type polysaccharide/polyol phosphate export permease